MDDAELVRQVLQGNLGAYGELVTRYTAQIAALCRAHVPREAVVPDLVQKIVKGQDPLHILGSGDQIRHYTYGGDLARGIVTAMEHPDAVNDDFNLSTAEGTSVTELARVIWAKLKGADVPLSLVHDEAFEYDVQRRVPSVDKAARVLGFEARTSLDEMLDEVIPWIVTAVEAGTI